jgi:hypothetical protein
LSATKILTLLLLFCLALLPAQAELDSTGSPLGECSKNRFLPLSAGNSSIWSSRHFDDLNPLRPMDPDEILTNLKTYENNERVKLVHFGFSHEGHPLTAALISAPGRMTDLDVLQRSVGLEAFNKDRPIVIWIGAAVHGNETSGAEAALAIIEHFATSDYEEVSEVLDHCLLIVDPLQNPDGRRRFLGDINRWNGHVANFDRQSLAHRSAWPSGRGNHYFMDLNRDWANLSQVETWGKVKLFQEYPPQVTFDLHEMGGQEGYLFSPPRAPFHPRLPLSTHHWWKTISRDIASSFGQKGWTCTTRDWHEEYNPNRGAAWPLHMGAISFLGEQFNTQGAGLGLPHGGKIGFRQAIEHQYLAALSLIQSSAQHHEGILADYARNRGAAFDKKKGEPAAYLISMEQSVDRALSLANNLAWMGLKLERTRKEFHQENALNYWCEKRGKRAFPAGSIILPLAQIQGLLARTQLEFDPSMSEEYIDLERKSLESGEGSRLYETTAWSLALASGCEVYALPELPNVSRDDFNSTMPPRGNVRNPEAPFAFCLSANSMGMTQATAQLHDQGIPCWGAGQAFKVQGEHFDAGSVIIKREDYTGNLVEVLSVIANSSRCEFVGLEHALVDAGQDLGSSSFNRLFPARIALLTGPPFYQTSFGALWHLFDQELAYPVSLIKLSHLESLDLGRYNVLVFPDASPGRGESLIDSMGENAWNLLLAWVNAGGTLITLGESSWMLCNEDEPVSSLRARRQVLGDISNYLNPGRPGQVDTLSMGSDEDAWLRRFSPQGAILRADLKAEHWICGGVGNRVPVMVKTDLVLLGKEPGQVLGRFASDDNLRLSGVLWPEAVERLSGSSYLIREAHGRGQFISFLGNPAYRAGFHGSARLLINAALLGPGMGARQSIPW